MHLIQIIKKQIPKNEQEEFLRDIPHKLSISPSEFSAILTNNIGVIKVAARIHSHLHLYRYELDQLLGIKTINHLEL